VRLARGSLDYGGGHRSDGHLEAYHHGIQTVINVLEHAQRVGLNNTQLAVLHRIGSITDEPAHDEGKES